MTYRLGQLVRDTRNNCNGFIQEVYARTGTIRLLHPGATKSTYLASDEVEPLRRPSRDWARKAVVIQGGCNG